LPSRSPTATADEDYAYLSDFPWDRLDGCSEEYYDEVPRPWPPLPEPQRGPEFVGPPNRARRAQSPGPLPAARSARRSVIGPRTSAITGVLNDVRRVRCRAGGLRPRAGCGRAGAARVPCRRISAARLAAVPR